MVYLADRTAVLDELLGISIADFDIPDAIYLQAVARYEDLGAWLSNYWECSHAVGIIYPQGAMRLGTVVQPINPRDDYDLDLVCRRDIAKAVTTQAALKEDCGTGILGYVRSNPDGSPSRKEGGRCWTLDYPGESFHMDVLPAIPNTDVGGNAIWLTDKDLREWQPSNPVDYADWFHSVMAHEFFEERGRVAKRMDVADVPAWQVRTALQRTVQALKRHRDMHFAKSPKDKPASIIITTLAARAYASGGTLYEVLADVTAKMPSLVEVRNGVYWVANPVHPAENFADRWRRHIGRDCAFFEWMEQAQADIIGYGTDMSSGLDRVLAKISATFGERSAQRAGEHLGTNWARAREVNRLSMSAGTGLLAAAPAVRPNRPVPQHTYHGSLPERRGE
ncbi:MAG TPA: nucleotidyltransferase [Acidimicrobiales bacterium]|nr:nucleotidyltransferase [Acidimicrobiales bacterium]